MGRPHELVAADLAALVLVLLVLVPVAYPQWLLISESRGNEDQVLQLVRVVAGQAPAPLAVAVHALHEAPPPYPGPVLRPYLDLRVDVYPKLRLRVHHPRTHHLACEPSCNRVKQLRF